MVGQIVYKRDDPILKRRRYYIQYQWRSNVYHMQYPQSDKRRYRDYAVIPVLFKSSEDAWAYLNAMKDSFINLRGRRKLSVSVQTVYLPKV